MDTNKISNLFSYYILVYILTVLLLPAHLTPINASVSSNTTFTAIEIFD